MRTLIARSALGLMLAGLLVSAGCKRAPAHESPTHVLRISQRNEPADLDPALATLPDEFFIIRALSEGLVSPRPDSPDRPSSHDVEPAAASHWELSSDQLVYTFHLRTDAYWSNGDEVTAADFRDSYRRLLTPATGSPKAALFAMVKNARAFSAGELTDFSVVGFATPDRRTLQITLEQPMPQFLQYVASGPWIPVNSRVVEKLGRGWTRPGNFVGNGPFILTEWRPHQRIVVKRNPKYHNAAAARLEEINFVACDNGDTEDRAFRAGQLDITMAVPPAKLEAYARDRPHELHRAPLAETRYLAFNTQKPPLTDERVRKALSLTIDRRLLTGQLLRGGQEPADRMVAPGLRTKGAEPVMETALVAMDVTLARTLLRDAGFPDGNGFPRLELSTWVNSPVTEAIQQMWKKELGIDVGLILRDAKIHVASLREGNYDVGLITAIPDVLDAANVLQDFTSDAPGNYPHWSDAQYDAAIRESQHATDALSRSNHLVRAEMRLNEACPLTPLYFNAKNWLMSSRVRGWQQDALWTRFYLNVETISAK
ncbi:MAG: peptide ABC transporter substrate-binding protein [Opitutus sp.]